MPGTLVLIVLVGDHAAALVELDADLVQPKALGVRTAADGDQHDIGFERLARRRPRPARPSTVSAPLLRSTPATLVAELEVHALLCEHALELLGDLAVHARHDAVEEFDHGHLARRAAATPSPVRARSTPAPITSRRFGHGWQAPARRSRRRCASRRSRRRAAASTSEPVAMTMCLASTCRARRRWRRRPRPCRAPAIVPAPTMRSRPCSS